MAKTKVTFDKIVENQNQLVETLTANAQKFSSLFEMDTDVEAFTKETAESYMAQGKEYMETVAKAEKPEQVMENMTSAFTKFMEMQTATYNKTADFYHNLMEKYSWKNSQEKFNQAAELYRDSFKAMADTAGANTKVLQEMYKSEN